MKYGWIELARQYADELLGFKEPESSRTKGQVNIPMQRIEGPEELEKLMELIEKLSRLERPSPQ
jgi:hypothetical protein